MAELNKLGFEAHLCELSAGENMNITATLSIEDGDGVVHEFRTIAWFGESWKEFS